LGDGSAFSVYKSVEASLVRAVEKKILGQGRILLVRGLKPLRCPWVGFRGSRSLLIVCKVVDTNESFWKEGPCLSKGPVAQKRPKPQLWVGWSFIEWKLRLGGEANSAEGGALWLLGPMGAAVDWAEGMGPSCQPSYLVGG